MSKVKASHIETLKSAGIKIIESHIHVNGGHIVIADVVHCSNGGGKKWREDRPLTLRSADSVFGYLDDIS